MDSQQFDHIKLTFQTLQDDICSALESLDGQTFREDKWIRPGGGGGRSRVLTGDHIEKGGVNFSHVYGKLTDGMADTLKVDRGSRFNATGVSIVLHARNPHIPIIHMNVRCFNLDGHDWWFGGGIDLTPIYIVATDSTYFHNALKTVCDRHDKGYYPRYKEWADRYFYLRHRKETRGIGGIFFDHLGKGDSGLSVESSFAFTKNVGESFVPIYSQLFLNNVDKLYNKQELTWQSLRRSRYVEFNLLWDRGTKFGLDTDGRTESILMSMPPEAKWVYNYRAIKGSEEEKTQRILKKPKDWII